MKKRINLYRPVNKTRSFNFKGLSGSVTILGVLVAVALVVGLSLTGYVSLQKNNLADLKSLKKHLDAEVVVEQGRFTSASIHPEIISEQARVNKELSALQDLKKLLQYVQPGQAVLFSKYLHSLAEASKQESWLTSFQINSNDKNFVFHGGANTANAVPVMLEAIVHSSAFKGTQVSDLSVSAEEASVIFHAQAELGSYE